jgi:predicted  nucleic acid-binding Zn-ribbon protein
MNCTRCNSPGPAHEFKDGACHACTHWALGALRQEMEIKERYVQSVENALASLNKAYSNLESDMGRTKHELGKLFEAYQVAVDERAKFAQECGRWKEENERLRRCLDCELSNYTTLKNWATSLVERGLVSCPLPERKEA